MVDVSSIDTWYVMISTYIIKKKFHVKSHRLQTFFKFKNKKILCFAWFASEKSLEGTELPIEKYLKECRKGVCNKCIATYGMLMSHVDVIS